MNQLVAKSNDIVNTISQAQIDELAVVVFQDHMSDADIAKHFGMSKPTLYKLKQTSRFQAAIKTYGEIAVREAHSQLQASSDKAVETLIDLLHSDAPQFRLKAATEILRLAGIEKPFPEFTIGDESGGDRALILKYLSELHAHTGKASGAD